MDHRGRSGKRGRDFRLSVTRLAAVFLLGVGCSTIRPPAGGGSGGESPDAGDGDRHLNIDIVIAERPADGTFYIPGCGSGIRDPGEACDDGNKRDGDGCSADCKTMGKDFACPTEGKACVYTVVCGDGVLGGPERCDPPNVGQGCSALCEVEPGYVCDPPPSPASSKTPSRCHKTTCGDGKQEGAEACDDGNAIDGDGCSTSCTLEPDCASGVCASSCGDHVKLAPEACDDGNTNGGDGCSSDCQVEVGFTCQDAAAAPPASLNLLVTYRDFISFPTGSGVMHPDFESYAGMAPTPMLVKTTLDGMGKPVMDGRCIQTGVTAQCPYDRQLTSSARFDEWYHDVSGVNIRIPGALRLSRNAGGAYVHDSANEGFYPIDGMGWVSGASPKETVALADAVVNDGRPHNFGFTTEVRYFFQYQGGESLEFSGDDDVWIFINRSLALDLGGLHPRAQSTLVLDQKAAALGLRVGGLYEIALFHAERHSAGSNFKLTLTGFAPTSSTCSAKCGDGVLASVEQCDDGNNADGDGCSRDCRYEDFGIP